HDGEPGRTDVLRGADGHGAQRGHPGIGPDLPGSHPGRVSPPDGRVRPGPHRCDPDAREATATGARHRRTAPRGHRARRGRRFGRGAAPLGAARPLPATAGMGGGIGVTRIEFYGGRPPGIEGDELPGRLIVLEGTDGVGRSTQVSLLKEWLEDSGYGVVDTGLRRSELAGRGIERALRGNTLDPITLNLLYATDFWDRLERRIVPALRAGMVALVDRYVFSLMARAIVRGVPADWIEGVYGFALVPDQVIYLDIDVDSLLPRVLSGRGLDYWE